MRKLLLILLALVLVVGSMSYLSATTDNPLRLAYGMTPSQQEFCRGLAYVPAYAQQVPVVTLERTITTPTAEERAAAELLYRRFC